MTLKSEVFAAINDERKYQDEKWGTVHDHPHEVGGWLTIMRARLAKADAAWSSSRGDESALKEILVIASLACACMEQHGIVEREGD